MRFFLLSDISGVCYLFGFSVVLLICIASRAQGYDESVLPPAIPWEGKSGELIVTGDDPWITPCEASEMRSTPRYKETFDWLEMLVSQAPELKMVCLGKSPEGRDINMVVASSEGAETPEELGASGKPVVLVFACIHSGESDGKDAGMMLLRDMTVRGTKRALLKEVSMLFIPIVNVDGHEHFSEYGRINQRGPLQTGWRTTSKNHNLNRDFGKLDTMEMRALVQVFTEWSPDLFIDIHVTDGVDYQYDITWGYNEEHGHSPNSASWLRTFFTPVLNSHLISMGHIPGPLVFAADSRDIDKGIEGWTAGIRYSNGYGDARHIPSVLVENHSLKPYKQRVLGTYVFLEGVMKTMTAHREELHEAIKLDQSSRRDVVPLKWKVPEGDPELIDFLGIESRLVTSPISGSLRVNWTGVPITKKIPYLKNTEQEITVTRPRAYWIPPAWDTIIQVLSLHGIKMDCIKKTVTKEFEMYRIENPHIETAPFEGHIQVNATNKPEKVKREFVKGSFRVPTDQPLGDLAILLLEPDSPDSFFQWGFFLEILQRTEYVENYVMEAMAEKMLEANSDLKGEFMRKLQNDELFARNPQERLHWFYKKTKYFDDSWHLYPVAREVK